MAKDGHSRALDQKPLLGPIAVKLTTPKGIILHEPGWTKRPAIGRARGQSFGQCGATVD